MIHLHNISKQYERIQALTSINLNLSNGEIVFLVGPNGAGKSTLMRLMCGYISPTEGEILIKGKNPQADIEALSYVGYVPENCPLYLEMNTFEYIKYMADLHQLSAALFAYRLPEILKELELQNVLTQKIETLSKGYRRRVGLAGALIHQPQILILDEPTEGLDPNQKHQMHQYLKEYGKEHLIIVSTHLMEEVNAVADRVILLNKGQIVWDGKPEELKLLAPDKDLETAFRLLTRGKKDELN